MVTEVPVDAHFVDLTVIPEQAHSTEPAFTHAVGIIGMGYVGLPTALSFAAAGRRVIGLEISPNRLQAIAAGAVDLLPSDHARLRTSLQDGHLTLTTSAEALRTAATVIICVPTPVDEHLVPDLRLLEAACATAVSNARAGQVLILTSTTYVGTTRDLLVGPLENQGLRVGQDIFVAFSPERIDPGNALHPQEMVPRVVGGVTDRCGERAALALSAYASRIHVVSSPEIAELTKLYENTFRAVNIALANEMADISRELRIDVAEVIEAAATKPYGFMPFLPGPGVGGHCIPCDPHYLLWQLKRDRRSAPLIEQAMSSIAQRPRQVLARAQQLLGEAGIPLRGARIVIVGVAYKPAVEDLRESPALEVLQRLIDAGADVCFFDPLVPRVRLHDGTVLYSDPGASLREHDLALMHTLHPGVDYSWAKRNVRVLDATYRFDDAPHSVTL